MKITETTEEEPYTITLSLNELIVIVFVAYYMYNFITLIGRNILK